VHDDLPRAIYRGSLDRFEFRRRTCGLSIVRNRAGNCRPRGDDVPSVAAWRGLRPHAVALLHDVTAEDLGLVPTHKLTPDDIYASVSDDPAVIEAGRRWDRATASTHRDLVAAVLSAQANAGVPPGQRSPLSSGAVEEYLTPLLMRMGRGDEPDVIAQMRRHTRRFYGEFAEFVMLFMLRTYKHRDTSALLAVATEKAAA
jgi:hypothetical protein